MPTQPGWELPLNWILRWHIKVSTPDVRPRHQPCFHPLRPHPVPCQNNSRDPAGQNINVFSLGGNGKQIQVIEPNFAQKVYHEHGHIPAVTRQPHKTVQCNSASALVLLLCGRCYARNSASRSVRKTLCTSRSHGTDALMQGSRCIYLKSVSTGEQGQDDLFHWQIRKAPRRWHLSGVMKTKQKHERGAGISA